MQEEKTVHNLIEDMKKYIRESWRKYVVILCCCIAYNAYFVLLLPEGRMPYLEYLDLLVGCVVIAYYAMDFWSFRKKIREEGKLEKEIGILEDRLREQYEENCNLQDYITKWCHELKIPLASCILMSERLVNANDVEDSKVLREQLERMDQLLKNVLLGCRLQSVLLDLQIQRVSLADCVRTSLHNNQFFLIHQHFDIQMDIEDAAIYSDKTWLVYVLDQIISNAVKYVGDEKRLHLWTERTEGQVHLHLQDYGEGIKEKDLGRIYEKGFTGENQHNGRYKSTGMGLYMAKKILDKLGHAIDVESVYGEYTRFVISFSDQRNYFFK